MKKRGIILFCILFMMFSLLPVHADMGPKSNIIINVECDEETYYMALLTPYEQYGPHRSNPQNCEGISCRFYEQAQLDGFYLIHDIETLSGNDTYSQTYMSPDIFKIILYLPDSDQFILSETYEKYAFQNTYRLIVDEENASLQLIEDYDYSSLIVTFLVCCSMTLLIELFIAFLFNYRDKKDFMFVVKTNCFTQILLHVYLQFMVYKYDFFSVLFYYLFAETAVLVIESFLYWKNLKKKSHPLLFAFIANSCSFLLGSYLLKTILYLIHYQNLY